MQIAMNQTAIGGQQVVTVNARELHTFLEVGRDFTSWVKGRIQQYQFVENQDYVLTFTKTGERKNVKVTDYHLTLDMAKELAMVENNDQGRQARRYFIEAEKALREAQGQQTLLVQAKVNGLPTQSVDDMPIMHPVRGLLESRIRLLSERITEQMQAQITRQVTQAACLAIGVPSIGAMTNMQGQLAVEWCNRLSKGPVMVEMPNIKQLATAPAGQLPAAAKLLR